MDNDAGSPVLHRFALGMPWTTFDPFLFCVHHDDAYPEGNGLLGPAAPLAGRQIGSDFSGRDGWSMYHGDAVPGFPQHPHRGFETVTFVRRGHVDHADSLRAAARYGAGDAQWLTAGAGIVHAEMFPLLREDEGNHLELFQIWLNLPRDSKMAPPHFAMLWAEDIPVIEQFDAGGRRIEITVVAGALDGHVPPAPPPDSWAARPGTDVAIWRVELQAGATWTAPVAPAGVLRTIYVFEGDAVRVEHLRAQSIGTAGETVGNGQGAVLDCTVPLGVTAIDGDVTLLVLQGRPIDEPVAQYGPFVMNDRAGVEQAFRDYQRTQFGGWPWPKDGPTHGHHAGRFVRRPDGSLELPPGVDASSVVG